MLWCTYVGGSNFDYGTHCATDALGNVYLTGNKQSNTAFSSPGSFQSTFGGNRDASQVKYNTNGQQQWSIYYGGGGDYRGFGCTATNEGSIYLVGHTASSANIATAGAHQTSFQGIGDGFIVEFRECEAIQLQFSGNQVICEGESLSINTSSSGDFKYNWNDRLLTGPAITVALTENTSYTANRYIACMFFASTSEHNRESASCIEN